LCDTAVPYDATVCTGTRRVHRKPYIPIVHFWNSYTRKNVKRDSYTRTSTTVLAAAALAVAAAAAAEATTTTTVTMTTTAAKTKE
jgi:hypothetical protein